MPESFDINALAESVGKDIFGAGEGSPDGSGEGVVSPPPPPSDGAAATQSAPTPAVASPAPPSFEPIPMPKAWKKEKETVWSALPREAQEYLTAREADVVKGFGEYSSSHKNWTELTSPFQQVLQQYPDVNPVQVLQTLFRNHLAMVQGSPEEKAARAKALLQGYGLDPAVLVGGNSPQPGATPSALPPEIAHRLQKVDQLERSLVEFQQRQQQAAIAEQTKVVEAFASDPKNEFYSEVENDILRFLQTGAAKDLAEAYELACYANPAVRAKLIAKTTQQTPEPKEKPLNVQGSAEGTPASRKPKTISDTIDDVVKRHYPTH